MKLYFCAAVLLACGPATPAATVPTPPVVAVIVDAPAPPPEPTAPPEPPKDPAPLEPPQPTLRLPKNFVPTGYTARLAIDPSKPTFDGAITIAGKVSEKSRVIWLHGYKLDIKRAVAQRDGRQVPIVVTPKGTELLELRAEPPLEAGAWTLALDYAGQLDAVNTTGAFRQTAGGQSYVFTQLEAVYARRVFPCVDEPDSKVPWKLTFDVPAKLTVVSNTPQIDEKALGDTTKRVEFAVSRPLPSYLVAFGIGPFEIVEAGHSKRGTPVRIVTLAKRAADAAYAVKTTPQILDLTEDWFGTRYPYEKLDMLSIPLTVGFGAMENAGLITFTETLMLLDAKASKARHRRWVVVASHEIAHQWFGNLVTPVYWDDIWLNEGFANWLETKISIQVEPGWRDDQEELETRNTALAADALVTARRIRQPIERADDIFNAFDRITYDKGASVLNMFERYLGPQVFQRGVREYLAAHAWGNATSNDFIAAISRVGAQSNTAVTADQIAAGFRSFLDQGGAPEIAAELSCAGGRPVVTLTQERYLPAGAPPPPPGTPWTVPVCIAFEAAGARGETCSLLATPSAIVALDTKTCPRWVMPNVDGRGYYRNAYTVPQITALRDEAWAKLAWTERRAIYFDVTALTANGKLPLQLALSFVPKLLAGNDRFTVGPAVDLPAGLNPWVPDDMRPKYELWLRDKLGPGALAAGFAPRPDDSLDIEETRSQLVGVVARNAREPALIGEAINLADRWRDLPQSIRGLVLAIVVDERAGFFDRILRGVRTEPDRSRRQEMYEALGGVRDVERQKLALALVLDPKLDIRESLAVLFVAATDVNRAVAQQFFREHQATILKRVPHAETVSPLVRMSGLFTSTCKADQRDAMADYVTKTFGSLPGGPRAVAQSIEAMDQCIARRRLLDSEIRAWLDGIRVPKPPKT